MVAVTDLLRETHLGLRGLVDAPGAPLRWVATSELDDPAPFLDGGELLLTTGLRSPRDGWRGWTRRLADAGVVAVGFGTGLSHAAVPQDLVRAGALHGVGVLEVPQSTPFIAVTRAVADLLRHGDNAADAAAAQVVRDMTRDASRPGAARGVLRRLASGIGGSAWLVDAAANILRAAEDDDLPPGADAVVRRMRPHGPLSAGSDVSREATLLVHPLEDAGASLAYLVVRAGPHVPRAWHGAVRTAAALLGVVVGHERAHREVSARWGGCALDLLASGQVAGARQVLSGGTGASLPDELRVLCPGVATAADLPPLDRAVVVAASPRRGDVVVLCPDDLLARTEGVLRAAGVAVGAGRRVALAEVEAGARSAASALRRTDADRPVVRADDPGSGELALAWGEEALRTWAEGVLAPLGTLAPADAAVLRASGHALLAHHGSRQDAARALGIHRNTLRQQLTRLERVLGRSWDSPLDRAELWFALEAAPPSGG